MHILKIFTTVLIWIFAFILFAFMRGLTWKKNKASIIGFSLMELVYALSLVCMWV